MLPQGELFFSAPLRRCDCIRPAAPVSVPAAAVSLPATVVSVPATVVSVPATVVVVKKSPVRL